MDGYTYPTAADERREKAIERIILDEIDNVADIRKALIDAKNYITIRANFCVLPCPVSGYEWKDVLEMLTTLTPPAQCNLVLFNEAAAARVSDGDGA